MPKKLKTLERNEGKAPLLVPHPEEEDENLRQLVSDSCRADSGEHSGFGSSQTGPSANMNPVAPTLSNISTTERSGA